MDRIEQQQKESPKKKITQSHHIEQQRVAGKKQKMDGSVLDRVIFFTFFFVWKWMDVDGDSTAAVGRFLRCEYLKRRPRWQDRAIDRPTDVTASSTSSSSSSSDDQEEERPENEATWRPHPLDARRRDAADAQRNRWHEIFLENNNKLGKTIGTKKTNDSLSEIYFFVFFFKQSIIQT